MLRCFFGSSFPEDQSDISVAGMLNQVKAAMTRPCTMVLIHCDTLYESLYDLLNQHYIESGGQRYVRLAHGSHSRQCPIHEKFRIVVVVDVAEGELLPPPLLNRF